MMWFIILTIFTSTQAYFMHTSNSLIQKCATNNDLCNPRLEYPCCDQDATCEAIAWNTPDKYACFKPVKLGTPCTSNIQCSGLVSMVCDPKHKECRCADNYVAINDYQCRSLLGGSCRQHSDCIIQNSVCDNLQCKCARSFVPKSNSRCDKTPLGEKCHNSTDCYSAGNAICNQREICECNEAFEIVNGAQCGSFLDGYCRKDSDCWAGHSKCVDNQCKCPFAFVPISHENCQLSPLGRSCEIDYECNSMFFGFGTISKKYECKEGKCMSVLGEFCASKEDCVTPDSRCINNVCTRKDGFIPRKIDWSDSNAQIHKECKRNKNCDQSKFLICSKEGRCVCKQGFTEKSDGICVPTIFANF